MVDSPAAAIGDVDIVIGGGRSLLEGMAVGRAAYMLDHLGADGWVSEDSYAQMERDGFSGLGGRAELSRARLRSDLLAYDPHMGLVNESLVQANHSAWEHARQLATLLASVAERPTVRLDSGYELARLARMHWHADWRSNELLREAQDLHQRLHAEEVATVAQAERAAEAERRLEAVATSLRWRVVQRLLAPLDAIRARLREIRARIRPSG